MPRATLITKREAADRVGVHPSTVQRWADSGQLRIADTVRTNGRPVLHLFRVVDVDRFNNKRAAA